MDQLPLYHEDAYEAARTVVQAAGGPTQVAQEMRPELQGKPGDARTWLNNCLNSERPEKLDLDQFVWLLRKGREEGAHALMWQLCREAGYHDAQPMEPEDERAKLQRQFVQAKDDLARLLRRWEELG